MKKIAVILCGSGYKDGSEIRESVGVLWALSQLPVEVQCFAPDKTQYDVINTLTGKPLNETRNMLVESARIARGKVKSLSELDSKEFDAVIIPGGFGAAKNLCNFALKGSSGEAIPEVKKVVSGFFAAKKPIGAVCIAPAILALSLKGSGLELTVGEGGEAADEIKKLGHKHVPTKVTDCHTDTHHKVVTTAAYMYSDAPLFEIFSGIQKLCTEVVRLS